MSKYASQSVAMIDSVMNISTFNCVYASNTATWASNNLGTAYNISASNSAAAASNYATIACAASSNAYATIYASNTSYYASNIATSTVTTAIYASNLAITAASKATYASNAAVADAVIATFASNASVWASNAVTQPFTGTATLTSETWFGKPVYSKAYTITSYATDVSIDSSLTSANTVIIECGGCAEYANRVIPIPCSATTSSPYFFVTPYLSTTGLFSSSFNTLDRLNIWIKYIVVSSYNSA